MNWISVKEKMPSKECFVLLYVDGVGVCYGFLDYYGNFRNHITSVINPTHWMPLPEPPKD